MVDWDYERGTFRDFHGRKGRSSATPENRAYFGRPGLTWSRRSQKGFSVRPVPTGCIFADKGPMVFVQSDGAEDLNRAMAYLNSSAAAALLEAMIAFGSYEVGAVQRMPYIDPGQRAGELACELSEQLMLDAQRVETDHLFVSPWVDSLFSRDGVIAASRQIDAAVAQRVGRTDLALPLSATYPSRWFEDDFAPAVPATAHNELSYLIGASFGRWDIRIASGELVAPLIPGPYEHLPSQPRGALILDSASPVATYPLVLPAHGILHDEPGHTRDVVAAVEAAIAVLEEGPCPPDLSLHRSIRDIRQHLRTRFSNDHLRDYSASRRVAPIYWYLTVASRQWGLWVYAPALDREVLFAIVGAARDKLRRLSQQRERLRNEEVSQGDRDAVARVEAVEELVVELEGFTASADSVAHSGWVPDLNDGLVLCAAPLLPLLADDRWRAEVSEHETKLTARAYPWASVQNDYFGA